MYVLVLFLSLLRVQTHELMTINVVFHISFDLNISKTISSLPVKYESEKRREKIFLSNIYIGILNILREVQYTFVE